MHSSYIRYQLLFCLFYCGYFIEYYTLEMLKCVHFHFSFQLETARKAANVALTGGVIGAVSTAGITWKYSRSLHGNP